MGFGGLGEVPPRKPKDASMAAQLVRDNPSTSLPQASISKPGVIILKGTVAGMNISV